MKKSKADHHRDRAGYWQTMYLLHATGGKPGRAKNAQRLYNFHMAELAREIVRVTGTPAQILLIP